MRYCRNSQNSTRSRQVSTLRPNDYPLMFATSRLCDGRATLRSATAAFLGWPQSSRPPRKNVFCHHSRRNVLCLTSHGSMLASGSAFRTRGGAESAGSHSRLLGAVHDAVDNSQQFFKTRIDAATIYFDISDLLLYLLHHTTLSGIQRVQCEILSRVAESNLTFSDISSDRGGWRRHRGRSSSVDAPRRSARQL
jgi:hypothetical protein